jgi:hypothetical protein
MGLGEKHRDQGCLRRTQIVYTLMLFTKRKTTMNRTAHDILNVIVIILNF